MWILWIKIYSGWQCVERKERKDAQGNFTKLFTKIGSVWHLNLSVWSVRAHWEERLDREWKLIADQVTITRNNFTYPLNIEIHLAFVVCRTNELTAEKVSCHTWSMKTKDLHQSYNNLYLLHLKTIFDGICSVVTKCINCGWSGTLVLLLNLTHTTHITSSSYFSQFWEVGFDWTLTVRDACEAAIWQHLSRGQRKQRRFLRCFAAL